MHESNDLATYEGYQSLLGKSPRITTMVGFVQRRPSLPTSPNLTGRLIMILAMKFYCLGAKSHSICRF